MGEGGVSGRVGVARQLRDLCAPTSDSAEEASETRSDPQSCRTCPFRARRKLLPTPSKPRNKHFRRFRCAACCSRANSGRKWTSRSHRTNTSTPKHARDSQRYSPSRINIVGQLGGGRPGRTVRVCSRSRRSSHALTLDTQSDYRSLSWRICWTAVTYLSRSLSEKSAGT